MKVFDGSGSLLSPGVMRLCGFLVVALAAVFGEHLFLPLAGPGLPAGGLVLGLAAALGRCLIFALALLMIRRSGSRGAGPAPQQEWKPLFLRTAGLYLAAVAALRIFDRLGGALTIVVAGLAAILLLVALQGALRLFAGALGRPRDFGLLRNAALAAASLLLALTAVEGALSLLAKKEAAPAPGKNGAGGAVVMPREWRRREVEVEGAKAAFVWHGKLHVFNEEELRYAGEFPPREEGLFRILAFGDSLTYGMGVDAADAYPAVIERELGGEYLVEVLNLGRCADQSEDVLESMKKLLGRLEPDLVLYGVCLNDFLPSRVGEYRNNRAWQVPFPAKRHFLENTLLGELVAARWDDLLMKAGVRADFSTDILRNFRGYGSRFARDVKAMNDFVLSRGLPPVIAMVLHQEPDVGGEGYRIVRAAEEHLRAAGMRLVPSEYIVRHSGRRDLSVSPWEGHPNEEAHRIFAGEILRAVREEPRLEKFRRTAERED